MAAGAAVPGLFFTFAAMVLLVFASVSSPTWDTIYYLRANGVHYGTFGFTGSQSMIGYDFQGVNSSRLSESIIHNLTDTLILVPIAAGLSGLAFLFGVCGAGYHRAGTVFMALFSALAMLTTVVAWVLAMVLFSIAKHEYRKEGLSADYGNALWLVLGAMVALFVGFCTSACGVFGSYRRRNAY
ncbi:unnamed protein product [Peniophora sp. CBMAI 1063]|nr:unnamed protein product [Peniophora sp. CBMAI 1063]